MSKLSRREFLENSMLAATVAGGLSQTPLAFAAEEGSSSPNERLRVAVLGVNGRGQSHLNGFMKRKDAEVVAIVDPDELVGQKKGVDRVEKSTGKKPAYFSDMREAFEDKSINAVSIATPNHWHSLAAIWAIQAGKDVYVEKPVSHNVSEGRRVVQAARKYDKICQTGTQSRSMPSIQAAIEFVHSGGIGEMNFARALCYKRRKSIGPKGNYDVPASVDYNIWLGPAPEKGLSRQRFHYDWHWQWDTGNGDLGNQGIHQMDVARWGLGVSDVGESVVSYGGRFGYVDAGNVANSQVSIHDYGKKTLVFEVRGLETGALRNTTVGVIFYGSEGYVTITSGGDAAAFDKTGKKLKQFAKAGYDHFDNFVQAVKSRKKEDLTADILEGHLSSALCHLGNISYQMGEKISAKEVEKRLDGQDEASRTFDRFQAHLAANKVDLEKDQIQFGPVLTLDSKKEVFTGELASAANPLLTRSYRKPFVVPAEGDI